MKKEPKGKENRCMSKRLYQKVICAALVSSVVVGNGTAIKAFAVNNTESSVEAYASNVYSSEKVAILDSLGDLETASVEWKHVQNASGYNVYYKKSNEDDSKYVQIDNMLIRQYSSYFRADVLGLSEGSYVIKVVPLFDGKEGQANQGVTSPISVKNHTREGFAFSKESPMKTASGGYNDDGTVPQNASILYITADNINTIKADVITNSKGSKTTCTGLVNILASRQKGYDKTPLIIRMVGEIKDTDINGLNSSGYLQLKGCYNVTLEGVGEDATINGWGLLIRGARNVEIRNLGVMLFKDDAISLDTDNENIWVHNNDIFYGTAGSDADQAKGDGSADVKGKSTYVTISYNHFWDSGKSSLCGMSDSEEFFVSYHHNWYDHSDSRHPRIRVGTIHIYNNYFDGNSKYGVGVTKGSSAFVESNVFRNTKYPMLSSLQGSDIAGNTKGTFSGEAGGMIKAYNNTITGGKGVVYAQQNSKQFDAYLASSRNELVPASYKTVSGGTTYNNFDTSSKMYAYNPDNVDDVVSVVTNYAGRVNGGDFTWKFTSADDDSYSVNSALMSKIKGYKSDVISIGGNSVVQTPDVPVIPEEPETPEVPDVPETPEIPEETPEVPETPETPEEPELPEISSDIAHNFTASGVDSSYFNINGNLANNKEGLIYNGLTLTKYLKLESSTTISFETQEDSTLSLVLNNDFSKNVVIDGVKYKAENGRVTVELEKGKHTITKGDVASLYYISLDLKNDDVEVPEIPSTPETPEVPEAPVVPENPETPDVPEIPETPEESPEVPETPEEPEETPEEPEKPSETKNVSVNFTTDTDYDKILKIDGNFGTNKTGVSYEGQTLTKYLKIESSTNISFETEDKATLTLVFDEDFAEDIIIDDVKYTAEAGILSVELERGTHNIKKADVAKVYLINLEYEITEEDDSEVLHSFTELGIESSYFNIKGNLGTDKVGVSYNGQILNKYLKIESSTDISFENKTDSTLTLVFNEDFSKEIYIDNVKYKAENGILKVELKEGKHTIKKDDSAKLYLMSIK